MKRPLIEISFVVDDRDLAAWLWQEAHRLNISCAALAKAILIDAMLDAREKKPSPVHEVTI